VCCISALLGRSLQHFTEIPSEEMCAVPHSAVAVTRTSSSSVAAKPRCRVGQFLRNGSVIRYSAPNVDCLGKLEALIFLHGNTSIVNATVAISVAF